MTCVEFVLMRRKQSNTFYVTVWYSNALGFITLDRLDNPEHADYQDLLPDRPIELMKEAGLLKVL